MTAQMLNTLHVMFEKQYTEKALTVDEIAQRISALGYPAPGSYRWFSGLTKIVEETATISSLANAHGDIQ